MISFTDDFAATLVLTIAGQTYEIPAANIKALELELHSYGFKGKVSFLVTVEKATDKLFTPITTKKDLIELSLQVKNFVKHSKTTSIPLKLSGLVTTRSFSEQTLTNVLPSQALVLNRHYHLVFADPAQVLWKQHYPCDLAVDSSLKTLITAHTSAKIQLTYDWPVLETVHPVLSLSLGASGSRASFYDFIMWLVDSQNGVFSYDCNTNKYTLSATKSSTGVAKSLNAFEIAQFGIDFPEVLRHQPNVLNSYVESAAITAITNEQMASPIRRDYLASYPVASDKQSRVTLETARFKQRLHEVWVDYQKFQLEVTPPGQLVNFKGSPAWNASLFNQPNTYRVREWRLRADWEKQGEVPGYSCYKIVHSLHLESSGELWVDLPSYTPPLYPFFVEGKIVSETGTDKEVTYQFYTDKKTSVNYYYTSIPLWTNKKVRSAYQPNLDTGQFYFPPYKNARVLIGLNFDNAFIANFLNWEEGAAVPQESLGNHLVMGKSTTNRNTIKHSYIDSKPDLQIQRTLEKDTELLQFSDGYIILRTQLEEGS
jgi:hypothetical protein